MLVAISPEDKRRCVCINKQNKSGFFLNTFILNLGGM